MVTNQRIPECEFNFNKTLRDFKTVQFVCRNSSRDKSCYNHSARRDKKIAEILRANPQCQKYSVDFSTARPSKYRMRIWPKN